MLRRVECRSSQRRERKTMRVKRMLSCTSIVKRDTKSDRNREEKRINSAVNPKCENGAASVRSIDGDIRR